MCLVVVGGGGSNTALILNLCGGCMTLKGMVMIQEGVRYAVLCHLVNVSSPSPSCSTFHGEVFWHSSQREDSRPLYSAGSKGRGDSREGVKGQRVRVA